MNNYGTNVSRHVWRCRKAVEKSYAVAEIDIESELYLNNADTGSNSDGNNDDDASVANGNAG